MPYAVSGAPLGDCGSGNVLAPGAQSSEEFYCPGAYKVKVSEVTVFATGRGLGNNYGHDASFKGYIGDSSFFYGSTGFGQETSQKTGGGNNSPSSCPTYMELPIISGVNHSGPNEYFVPLEWVVVQTTSCGNPTKGIVQYVIPGANPHGPPSPPAIDPYGIVSP